jgi:hypothetical protein
VILKQIIFELLSTDSLVSAAPRLLPILAPEWGLANLNQFASEGQASSTTGDPFPSQTRLKLSLVQFLVVSLNVIYSEKSDMRLRAE